MMDPACVMIVEDDVLIALDMESALLDNGWEICGIAASEEEALRVARAARPPFALVDVRLAPGDGRVVARELLARYGTAVMLVTAHCNESGDLARTGALACLPKPFSSADLPDALEALRELKAGKRPGRLPDHMLALAGPGH